ncbi:hypothetical protein RRF57_010369 [Xylaria bambusicola]|uniref:Uncharacterized protein n=1 Tax=Xylaria bambusicola TaxID=326684 RepID=A0AAN7ZCL2_9PEZI
MSTNVFGVVAALDPLKEEDPFRWNRTFMSRCHVELYGDGTGITNCNLEEVLHAHKLNMQLAFRYGRNAGCS